MSPLMHFEALLLYVNTYKAPPLLTAHQLDSIQLFMAVPATQLSSHLCVLCVCVCICLCVCVCLCVYQLSSHLCLYVCVYVCVSMSALSTYD